MKCLTASLPLWRLFGVINIAGTGGEANEEGSENFLDNSTGV